MLFRSVNPNPEAGRTGSLQLGLRALISEIGRTPRKVLVVPVDRCGWTTETIDKLVQEEKNTSPSPSGHPLLLKDIDVVLGLSKDSSLRENLQISKIEAPGRHMNIDSPEDLEMLR